MTQLTQNRMFTFSGYSTKWRRGDVEEMNSWIKLLLFSFAHKKYSCSFINLRHMDYFTDVLTAYLDLDRVGILSVYGRVRELSVFIKKYLNLCSEDERGFGTTWRWVINDIFGWTIPLNLTQFKCHVRFAHQVWHHWHVVPYLNCIQAKLRSENHGGGG